MAAARASKHASSGRLIGYARVPTEDQGTDPQLDELRAAGCDALLEEHASGADRGRPVLARLLREIRPGETLVVVRLDRLARSVTHLLAVIEQLEASGAHFRSLRDPIDTATPQGMFSLQVLGAVAQLERSLIAERTKSGLNAARARGRVGGNPALRAADPDAIRKVRASRDAAHLRGVLARLDSWLPTVRRMRPNEPWGDVARVLNHGQAATWTVSGCAARCGGWRMRASWRQACWAARGRDGATIAWSGWSPASRRRRPATRCSRSPPSSRPCGSVRRGAARDGILPRSSTSWPGPSGSAWPAPRPGDAWEFLQRCTLTRCPRCKDAVASGVQKPC